jgi:competence protein ComFB
MEMLKNYMEIVVDIILPVVIENYGNICRCDKCINDIKALALNNLQPHYVATVKGEVYTKINQLEVQFRADTITALVNSIEQVSRNSRHEI